MNKVQPTLSAGELYLPGRPQLNLPTSFRLFRSFWIRKSKYQLLLLDELALGIMLFLAASKSSAELHVIESMFLMLVWVFIGYVKNCYTFVLIEDAEVIVRRSFYHWLSFSLVAAVLYPFFFDHVFVNGGYFFGLILTGITVFFIRVAFLTLRKKHKHLIVKNRQVAIIGSNLYSDQLETYISEGCADYSIHSKYSPTQIQLYSEPDHSDIFWMAKRGINEIFCCISAFSKKDIQQLMSEADRYMIRVKFLPEFLNVIDRQVKIEALGNIPVLTVRPEPLLTDRNRILKRAFDICFSLVVIVFVLSWLIPIIWVAIRLESKGPLFFKQKRSGIDNRAFSCFKFRSMTANNKTSDTQQASKNDKRITRVGAFLRKTSLDELPQFFNVLMGNMSVVGPRPHMLAHTDQYREEVNAYMIRHYVQPGITGWAQVRGYRGETKELEAMQKRVEHDIVYVENWTFLMDLKIIFLTVWNVIRGEKNAY